MRKIAWLAILCLLLTGLLAGCGDDGTGKGFRFPLEEEPMALDPQLATSTSTITLLSVLFEGLTRLDAAGEPVPGAATWEVSEDGKTYTFTLKESYWSPLSIRGEETPWNQPVRVVADDFVYGLQRILSPETDSPLAKELYGITNAKAVHTGKKKPAELGVKATSDTQLVITLAAPDPQFLRLLATTPCMPCNRDFFAYTAGRYGVELDYLLSNGPFRLVAWNHNESLLMYKNEGYHAAATVAPEAVRYVINTDEPVKALTTGALDVAPLTTAQAVTAATAAGVTVVGLEDSLRSLWFNTATDPMTVPQIRQALRDSIQWDAVYAHLSDAGEVPAVGYVSPAATVPGDGLYRREDNRRPFSTRIEAAQKSLKAGLSILYPENETPRLPTITLVAADDPVSSDLARYILQSWQKNLKLSVKLITVSPEALNRQMARGFYAGADAVIYTHTPTGLTGGENLSLFATGAAGNRAGYTNKAVDTAIQKALDGGRKELDALEKQLWEACPTLPLSYPKRYYGIAETIQDITVRPFGGGVYGAPLEFLQAKKWD